MPTIEIFLSHTADLNDRLEELYTEIRECGRILNTEHLDALDTMDLNDRLHHLRLVRRSLWNHETWSDEWANHGLTEIGAVLAKRTSAHDLDCYCPACLSN